MAELLIYDRTNWVDLLTSADWLAFQQQNPDNWQQKYVLRWQRGQVVDMQEDGFFTDPQTGRGWDRNTFRLLCLPGVTVKDAEYLTDQGIAARRRWRVETGTGEKVATLRQLKNLAVAEIV